jgi:hypothetical protein
MKPPFGVGPKLLGGSERLVVFVDQHDSMLHKPGKVLKNLQMHQQYSSL